MANYNKNITLVVGGSVNAYFYRQNVQTGDTLTVRVNNGHNGYNGWYGYVGSGTVTPTSHSNSSGSGYGFSPSTGIVFTVTGGTYYRLVFVSYSSSHSPSYKTHHIFGTVTAGTTSYSLSAPSTIQEGTTGTVNISATNHTPGTVYWAATPAADFSPDTGSAYVPTNGSSSFNLSPVSDNSTEGNETGTIRLYSNSARTVQIASTTTTITDQSSSGGGSTGGSSTPGNTTQGIEVFSQSGTKIFGTDLRTQNLQYEVQLTLAGNATSSTYAMADANDPAKCVITTLGYNTLPNTYTINLSSTGWSITNNTGSQRTVTVLAFRIG